MLYYLDKEAKNDKLIAQKIAYIIYITKRDYFGYSALIQAEILVLISHFDFLISDDVNSPR